MFIQSIKKGFLWSILVVTILFLAGCGQDTTDGAEEVVDESEEQIDTEEQVDEELRYERIVVDSPAVAHYMAMYDIPLVGIPTTSKPMPEQYEGLTEIGVAPDPNIEQIVSLDPDIFIGDEVLAQFSQDKVESRGIETLYIDNSSYDAVYDSILQLGESFGMEEVGEEFIAEQKEREEEVLSQAKELEGKSFALFSGTAEAHQIQTKHSYLGSIFEKIGMENIADEVEDTDQGLITFNKESIVSSNPDYIIAHAHGGNPEQVEAAFKDEFAGSMWEDTTAKQNNQIYYIDSFQFPVTGSVDNVDILESLVKLLESAPEDGSEE